MENFQFQLRGFNFVAANTTLHNCAIYDNGQISAFGKCFDMQTMQEVPPTFTKRNKIIRAIRCDRKVNVGYYKNPTLELRKVNGAVFMVIASYELYCTEYQFHKTIESMEIKADGNLLCRLKYKQDSITLYPESLIENGFIVPQGSNTIIAQALAKKAELEAGKKSKYQLQQQFVARCMAEIAKKAITPKAIAPIAVIATNRELRFAPNGDSAVIINQQAHVITCSHNGYLVVQYQEPLLSWDLNDKNYLHAQLFSLYIDTINADAEIQLGLAYKTNAEIMQIIETSEFIKIGNNFYSITLKLI